MNDEVKDKNNVEGAEHKETTTLSRADYEAILKKISEYEMLQERMLRTAADYENAKKRIAKEREEFAQYALESFLFELLMVLDNFERALAHKSESVSASEKSIWSGIELIQKQLNELLKLRGLKRMETVGKVFDPQIHDAVSQIESQEYAEGTIAEEILAGYFLHAKVLRPAKVKVYTKQKQEEKIEEIT